MILPWSYLTTVFIQEQVLNDIPEGDRIMNLPQRMQQQRIKGNKIAFRTFFIRTLFLKQ